MRGGDRQSREPQHQDRCRCDYLGRDMAPRAINRVAEQRAGSNPANSSKRLTL